MQQRFRYILILILLLTSALPVLAGKAVSEDDVCIGTTRTYWVVGLPGSTYTWKINGEVQSSTVDSIVHTWNSIGAFKLEVQEHQELCSGEVQQSLINVFELPQAFAGRDTTICYENSFLLANATAQHYSSLQWNSSGDGSFDDPTLLHPVYTPGVNDRLTGKVLLTLTAQGLGADVTCTPGQSTMVLNILHLEADLKFIPVSCFGATDGSIAVVDARGGSGQYEFSVDDGEHWIAVHEMPFKNLPKGDYEVKMRDRLVSGCVVSLGSGKIQEPELLVATVGKSDATCLGNDGIINVSSPSGGWGNYHYRLNENPWQASGDFPDLVPGSYEVWIGDADAPDCKVSLGTVIIVRPEPLTAKVEQINVSCFNAADGSISVSEPSGSGSYEYRLNEEPWVAQSGLPFENLRAGEYVVQMRDIYTPDCMDTIATITITQPDQLMATVSADDISCYGSSDGKITVLTATGGRTQGKYEYRLNDMDWQTSKEFTRLSAGKYTIWMRDAEVNTCEVWVNELTISDPPQLTATVTSTNITCNGSTDGKIEITDAKWLSPFLFTIDDGAGIPISNASGLFTGLKAGVYTVKMSDANHCEQVLDTITIIEPDPLYADVVATNETCLQLGTITLSNAANSFSGLYQYSIDNWKNWNTTGLFNSLSPGDYTVEIRDALIQTCVRVLQTVTIQPLIPMVAQVKTAHVTCYAGYDGSITLSGQKGGSGQYQYSMDKDNDYWFDSPIFENLYAGSYKVWMRDKISPECVIAIGIYEIMEPDQLMATPQPVDVTCFGASDGKITFNNPSGGSQPGSYEYSINGIEWVSAPIENLVKGTYALQMRDVRVPTCVVSLGSVVIEEPKQLTATVTPGNVKCYGESNGEITITNPLNGSGAGSYQFRLNGGAWTNATKFTGLAAGDYTIEIQDALAPACTALLGTVTIGQPDQLQASETHTHQSIAGVNNGSITVQGLQGGTSPYRYSLDGNTWQTEDLPVFAGLAPGDYTVLVRDANDCELSLPVTILPMGSIRADYSFVAVTCYGGNDGNITFTNPTGATNGHYQFSIDAGLSWSDQLKFVGLNAAASYNLKVRDADNTDNQTLLAANFQLSQPAQVSASVIPSHESALGANDGTITISNYQGGSAGYEYRLDNGAWITAGGNDQITGLAPKVYILDIQDNNKCSFSYTIDIQKYPASGEILATILPTNTCFNASTGKLTISNVSGGQGSGSYQYRYKRNSQTSFGNWADYISGQAIIDNLAKGIWDIEISDGTSTVSFSREIKEAPELKFTLTQATPIACYGDETFVNMVASGGKSPYEYYYRGNKITSFASGAGTYDITVVDANNCSKTATITISQPGEVRMVAKGNDPLTCEGRGSIDMTFANVADGNYTLLYNDGVNDLSKPITIKANKGTLPMLLAGRYEKLRIVVKGCTSKDTSIVLSDPSGPVYTVRGSNPSTCLGKDGQIIIDGLIPNTVYSVSLDNGTRFTSKTSMADGTIAMGSLAAGTYRVVLKLAGCTGNVLTVVLTDPLAPTLAAVGVSPLICGGNGSIDFTLTQVEDGKNYTILYTGGKFENVEVSGGQARVLTEAGTYSNLKIVVNQCTSSEGVNVVLTDPQPPAYAIKETINPLSCGGSEGVIVISGLESETFYVVTANNWVSSASYTSNSLGEIQILGLSAGNYQVAVSLEACKGLTIPVKLTDPISSTILAQGIHPLACGADGTIEFTFTGVPDGNYIITYKGGQFDVVPVSNNKASVKAKAGSYENFEVFVNGCPSAVNNQVVLLSDPDAPTYMTTGTGPLSCGGNQGRITINGLKSNTTYKVRWMTEAEFVSLSSDSKGQLLIDGLSSGTYEVTLGLDNCLGNPQKVVLSDPSLPVLAAEGHHPTTCGGNGTIDFMVQNVPDGPYTITYDGGSFPVTVVAGKATVFAPQGVYAYLAIRVNSCSSAELVSVTLNDPPGIMLWAKGVNAACYNEPGRIDFKFENVPDGIYSITYDGGQFDQVTVSGDTAVVSAAANTYTNLRISVNNCTSPAAVEVTLNNPPAVRLSARKTNGKCFGDSVTFNFEFEQVPDGEYTISFNGGQFDKVKIVDSKAVIQAPYRPYYENFAIQAGNCSATYFRRFYINYPDVAGLTARGTDPAACGLNGKIQFAFTNVPDGNRYLITYHDGLTDRKFENVTVINEKGEVSAPAGIYNALKIWVNGCPSASDSVSLKDPAAPAAPIVLAVVHPDCEAPGNVELGGLPSAGDWNLNYEKGIITGTGQSILVADLSPGIYHFTVTNAEGCISGATEVIINPQPLAPVLAVTEVNNPLKCGDKGSIVLSLINIPDGIYTIVYSGGTFTGVEVSNGAATIEAGGGTYTGLQVTGTNGCLSNKVDATLVDPSAPQAPVVGTLVMPTCAASNGSVVLSGLPEGNWIINPGNIPGSTRTYTVTGLEANTIYYFTVTSESGCTSGASVAVDTHIPGPAAPTATVTQQPNCNKPTGTIKVLTPVPSTGIAFVLTGISPVTDPVTSTDGLFENLTPGGSYNIKVMDRATGCFSTEISMQINAMPASPAAPDLSVTVTPTCNNPDGTVMVNRPRGSDYQYSMDGGPYQGSAIFAGLRWGDHTVKVRNVKTGCVSPESKIAVPAIPPPPVITAKEDRSICYGGTGFIEFSITNVKAGKYTIHHDKGQFEVTISADGTGKVVAAVGKYTNLTMEVGGCSSYNPDRIVSVEVTQPDDMVITSTITPINLTTNSKASVSLNVTGGNGNYTYSWSNGATTRDISNLDPGSYTVRVFDENNCYKDYTLQILLPTVPHAFDDNYSQLCNIISGNVILNDIDQENDRLFINETSVLYPKHGTLALYSDGTFEYHADLSFTGIDSFKYELFDKNRYPGIYGTVILEILPDKDRDGVTDAKDKDKDGDGILNDLDGLTDVDKDGWPNDMDIDSDGDGIPDQVEAQSSARYVNPVLRDENDNGVDDAYDNFQFTRELTPVDTDNDGTPDFLDLDSDNDLVPDAIEGQDLNADGRADQASLGKDEDGDGLDNGYDTYFLECDPSDNIIRSNAVLQDFDGDGMPDWRDENDDDDDFLTKYEDMDGDGDLSNDDFDYDGHPEYLDYGRECDLFIPDAFSPNNDGVHDYYQIYCINHYPNAKIYIFDQLGNKLYEKNNYGNLDVWKTFEAAWWDGMPDRGRGRGELVAPGTYYYVLDLGNGEVKKSFVFVSY